jgi:hypothetical protein
MTKRSSVPNDSAVGDSHSSSFSKILAQISALIIDVLKQQKKEQHHDGRATYEYDGRD